MKLIYHDNKHQHIIAKLELGNLTHEEDYTVRKVLDFLYSESIIDQYYKDLTLCDDMYENMDSQTGEKFLTVDRE